MSKKINVVGMQYAIINSMPEDIVVASMRLVKLLDVFCYDLYQKNIYFNVNVNNKGWWTGPIYMYNCLWIYKSSVLLSQIYILTEE